MWSRIRFSILLFLLPAAAVAADGIRLDFNPDWKFIKADPADAAKPELDDRGWTAVSLPHTFNDVDTFDDWSKPGHIGEMNQWAGRTWYRKTFVAPMLEPIVKKPRPVVCPLRRCPPPRAPAPWGRNSGLRQQSKLESQAELHLPG